jgi:hypothetical protein
MKLGKISLFALVLLSATFFGGAKAKANGDPNWGYLTFRTKLSSTGDQTNRALTVVKDDELYSGATDGFDLGIDIEESVYLPGLPGNVSDVDGRNCYWDVTQNSSRTARRIKGFYNGTIEPGSEPNIIVEFSWDYPGEGEFGTIPLSVTQEDSDGNNIENGYRGDARAEIDYGSGVASINFGKLPAGSYTENTPFLHLRIDFEKLLADLNNDNEVNLKDYAIAANYWKKEGMHISDISGPNDVPDKKVDYWDLSAFCGDYLKEE